jgi:hypothetical protein
VERGLAAVPPPEAERCFDLSRTAEIWQGNQFCSINFQISIGANTMRSNSVDIIFITWRKAHQNRCLNGKQDFQIQEIDFREIWGRALAIPAEVG